MGLGHKLRLALPGQLRRQLFDAIPCDAARRGLAVTEANQLSMLNSLFDILRAQLGPLCGLGVIALLGENFRSRDRQWNEHFQLREPNFYLEMTKRVILKASDVAAIIGRHQYKTREDIFNEYWKKYSPETFTGQTQRDRAAVALRASPVAREVMNCVSQLKPKDSTEVQNIVANVRNHINSDANLTPEQKAEVISHITSNVYTAHGTRAEDRTADKVTVDTGKILHRDNSFYNLDVWEIGQSKFVICGKIDRIEEAPDGSRILVEIKNRTNRLFRRVVEYEFIQIQVYLQMLGLVHARLVEQYNSQVLSHDVDRDEEMWTNEIMPALRKFCAELHEKFE
jgi:hypothetical protein